MGGFIRIPSMFIISSFLYYNYNTVSGEAGHIATGHAMRIFNYLHYSLLA
jgi:hypothetical protein